MNTDDMVRRAHEIARIRTGSHSAQSNAARDIAGRGRLHADVIGALGELVFAEAFGLQVRVSAPHGDGGVDWAIEIHGQPLLLDVKATDEKDPCLMVPDYEIDKPTDVYVLVQWFHNHGRILGWEHRAILRCMPKHDFGRGVPTHYRHWTQLRRVVQLAELLAMRDSPRLQP